MTLQKLAKMLDDSALAFAQEYDINKSMAALSVAAFIRTMYKDILKEDISEEFYRE